ncbi:MAG TPA: HAD-IC family P-type ATPase, partial [Syntrophobacteraceae bacterium]|nr:HAD-IC family P-type ATPase [Syntrophobacteraceae bacterium]
MNLPRKPWSREWQEVTKDLEVSAEEGLSTQESRRRRKQFGSNRLRATRRRSGPAILVDQIKNPIVLLLAVAAAVSFSFSRVLEGISILIAVVINCTIGFFTELKAVRSMEALHRLSRVTAKTLRERRLQDAPSEELVPGDIVMLEAGDLVPADLRLTEASRLQIDESAITGESVPVTKSVEVLEEQTSMAERANMALKGTAVTAGSGHGVVTATGMNTELGRVASMVEEAEGETTPLEKKLDRLAYRLLWITLGIGVIVAVTGVAAQKEIFLII